MQKSSVKIYIKKQNSYLKLAKISKHDSGIYIINYGIPNGKEFENKITYHQDGHYWQRQDGKIIIRKIRNAFCEITEPESLSINFHKIIEIIDDMKFNLTLIKQNDILIELETDIVYIEYVLSGRKITDQETKTNKINKIIEIFANPYFYIFLFDSSHQLKFTFPHSIKKKQIFLENIIK